MNEFVIISVTQALNSLTARLHGSEAVPNRYDPGTLLDLTVS